jgi:hypothetical protein
MSKKKEQFCPDCGEKSYHLVRHRNTGICKAKQNARRLESLGYHKCLGTNSIIKRAGIEVTYETVSSGPNVANAYYAPKWAVAVALHRNLHPEERVAALKNAIKKKKQTAIDTLLRISGIDLEWWSAVQEFHYTDIKSERAPINKIIYPKKLHAETAPTLERRDVMTAIIEMALSPEGEDQ